ncbi:MAG: CHAT domain-containing protein [Clostridiales bacterium]|nr:CHAT domain-containing protein [Clostridiales bacterium]
MRSKACWLVCLMLLFSCASALAQETDVPRRQERALLIGVDEFVSKPSAAPSSTNNVYAMQEMFQAAATPLSAILLPDEPVTSAAQLTQLIQSSFAGAAEGDVSYLYISTHGIYDPENGVDPQLLLSDGVVEGTISPAQLEAAFDGIGGTKVIILDACNSGAFIGKGMAQQPESLCFLGDDFKVLTSSGALEESWYWNSGTTTEQGQGAFYFTQALTQALSPSFGYPADQNRDGSVTLRELYEHLLQGHAASTPQVYPQADEFVLFRYNTDESSPAGSLRSPIMDVTFSGNILSRSNRDITIEFIAVRPVQVGYQVVYQREGKWKFDEAQLIYDEAERFTVFGDQEGAVSPGRKVRTLTIGDLPADASGYALVQLVSIEEGKLMVHAGRVLCVLPETGVPSLQISAPAAFSAEGGREMSIFVAHDIPCALSLNVIDEEGATVHRICHKRSTRPMQLIPEGSVFYWDGRTKDGQFLAPGTYRVQVEAYTNGQSVKTVSDPFTYEPRR